MIYKAIGIMSGSSLDGLDIAYVHFQETAGKWTYEIMHTQCLAYTNEWVHQLQNATSLSALNYQLLHTAYGHYIGQQINNFIATHQLHHQVDLVASHGHTTFHIPARQMTAQLGDGAAIAAQTGLPVISDLRAMDIAFNGQGAPIVPIGEKLLFSNNEYFLNLGGIANISLNQPNNYIAFDVCPANRVLNMLMQNLQKQYDENGNTAQSGKINETLLNSLNQLPYYQQAYPKSLANDFGTQLVYPLLQKSNLSIPNQACTYVEHIAIQIKQAIKKMPAPALEVNILQSKLLVTGGGALNGFMVQRIQAHLAELNIKLEVPHEQLVSFKEALIMALIGVLRWREAYNVLSSVTGAKRNTINGAVWMGAEA